MVKKRKAIRRPKSSRKSSKPVKGRKQQPLEFAKSSLTIRFTTEDELRERLADLTMLFPARHGASLEAVSAADSCLSLIQSAQIVARALSPKILNPPEKLGDTYLTTQERELFKARVVRGVTAAGCQIGDTDVPAEEGTTHSAVVGAIRENAHD